MSELEKFIKKVRVVNELKPSFFNVSVDDVIESVKLICADSFENIKKDMIYYSVCKYYYSSKLAEINNINSEEYQRVNEKLQKFL
jgi:hypothetical protein